MARADLLNRLYSAHKTPLEFQFQSLIAPPLLSLLSPYDIKMLNDLARDPRLSAKLNKKLEIIKSILEPRGFIKFHSGTNRVVYRFLEDQSFLIKISLDKTGLSDNPMEYKNQFLLAPFVTKVFESTPCGTVGLFERVEPITSRQEFISIAEDVFDLLNDKFIGQYVLEDIGTEYFMNWGIRRGFGPVLLDFPYCYKLDGNKLYCNKIDLRTNTPCGGAIDYDNGFNNLICSKCKAKIFAKDLEMGIDKHNIILKGRKEHSTMKIKCFIPGKGEKESDTTMSAKTYAQQVKKKKASMKISILNNRPMVTPAEEVKQLYAQSQASKAKKQEEENKIKYNEDIDHNKENEEIVITSGKMANQESSRNTNRHEYAPKQSAPYAKPEDLSLAYVNMNKDDDDDQEIDNDTEEDTVGEKSDSNIDEDNNQEIDDNVNIESVEETKKEINTSRSRSTIRKDSSNPDLDIDLKRRSIEANNMIPNYDDNGKYPKKKRDSKGKFIK